MLAEGWYLMDVADVERLVAWARGEGDGPRSAVSLTTEQALAYRDEGNLPDPEGRTLRLVIHLDGDRGVEEKRLRFEPDLHDPPTWRREGSRPVNVIPLRRGRKPEVAGAPWWEDEDMGALETEWREKGSIDGVAIPGEYRSFLFKTIVALRRAGREVTPETLVGSISRWVRPDDLEPIARALEAANAERGRR